jgi:hypothetical protein
VGEDPVPPEGEEGGELPPAEAVSHAEALLQHSEQAIAAGKVTVANAVAALGVEQDALAAIVKVCAAAMST